MTPLALLPASVLAATAACAIASRAAGQAPQARPLAPFVARRVLVLPTHYLRPGDSLGWAAQIANPRDYLDEVDAEIAFALGERGVKEQWVFPPALVAAAKRNPTYAPDPYGLAAQWLRPPIARAPDQLPEPLASQLRTLIALHEDAQYVLFPVEIRFEPVEDGKGVGRAVLRVVLLDARRSRIRWMVDIASDPVSSFSPALAASAAEHLADLVADRPR